MSDWTAFTHGLVEQLAVLPSGAIVKLIGFDLPERPRGAQIVQEDDRILAELVGLPMFERADTAAVAAAGWHEPDAAHGYLLWWANRPWPLTTDRYRELATMIVIGLRDGLKIPEPAFLRYQAWNENAENRPLTLPRLGIGGIE